MIYRSEDGKHLHVDCECGCGEALTFNLDKNPDEGTFMYQMYSSSAWFIEQYGMFGRLSKKLKKIWAIIRNKDFYYGELVLSKKDVKVLADYLLEVVNDQGDR